MKFEVRKATDHRRTSKKGSNERVRVWKEHREHSGPPATFRHKTGNAESTFARTVRLQLETPKCQVCGAESVTYRRTLSGHDEYRCGQHIGSTVRSTLDAQAIDSYIKFLESGATTVMMEL